MTLPQDPIMLMSMVNMKLRDGNYDSLTDLCAEIGIDEEELCRRLSAAGFDYMPAIRQFR